MFKCKYLNFVNKFLIVNIISLLSLLFIFFSTNTAIAEERAAEWLLGGQKLNVQARRPDVPQPQERSPRRVLQQTAGFEGWVDGVKVVNGRVRLTFDDPEFAEHYVAYIGQSADSLVRADERSVTDETWRLAAHNWNNPGPNGRFYVRVVRKTSGH